MIFSNSANNNKKILPYFYKHRKRNVALAWLGVTFMSRVKFISKCMANVIQSITLSLAWCFTLDVRHCQVTELFVISSFAFNQQRYNLRDMYDVHAVVPLHHAYNTLSVYWTLWLYTYESRSLKPVLKLPKILIILKLKRKVLSKRAALVRNASMVDVVCIYGRHLILR